MSPEPRASGNGRFLRGVRGSRAQSAFEYLIITAFVLGVLAPAILLVSKTVQDYQQSTAANTIASIGQDILANAESVYFFGPPSQVVLDVQLPEGIKNMSIHRKTPALAGCTRCTELRFTLGRSDIVLSTDVDVRGPDPYYTPDPAIQTTVFPPRYFSSGRKRFVIKATPGYALLNLTT